MKTLISIYLIFVGINLYGQEPSNELKLNTLLLLSTKVVYPELSYERLIGNKSAVGISLGFKVGTNEPKENFGSYLIDDLMNYDFSALPYYRRYFGKKRANGFFLEANAALFSRDTFLEEKNELGFGLGLALGVKMPLKNNWSVDLLAGGGSNLNQKPCVTICVPDLYSRLGVTIAKRF